MNTPTVERNSIYSGSKYIESCISKCCKEIEEKAIWLDRQVTSICDTHLSPRVSAVAKACLYATPIIALECIAPPDVSFGIAFGICLYLQYTHKSTAYIFNGWGFSATAQTAYHIVGAITTPQLRVAHSILAVMQTASAALSFHISGLSSELIHPKNIYI